jgi:hypothetical protein
MEEGYEMIHEVLRRSNPAVLDSIQNLVGIAMTNVPLDEPFQPRSVVP